LKPAVVLVVNSFGLVLDRKMQYIVKNAMEIVLIGCLSVASALGLGAGELAAVIGLWIGVAAAIFKLGRDREQVGARIEEVEMKLTAAIERQNAVSERRYMAMEHKLDLLCIALGKGDLCGLNPGDGKT